MWTWNTVKSDFWGNRTFDTREEAIEEARQNGNTDFYIGECEFIPLRTDADIDRIMEELDEMYSSDSGCDDYIYDGVSEDDRKWFEEKLQQLVEEFHERANIKPNWFKVVSEQHIKI